MSAPSVKAADDCASNKAVRGGPAPPSAYGARGPFSIVMPARDTPREREFAKKSVPSALALGPSEVVVGIDEGPDADDFEDHIRSQAGGLAGLRVVRVPKSDKWKFSLANTIWHCYKECNHDAVLAFDVDTVLRPSVLKGRHLVGRNNVAVVSFTKRLFSPTIGDRLRYASYRWRVWRSSYVFAGTYWVWLPYYFAAVDRQGLSQIVNGIDTYMLHALNLDGRYSVVTLKDIGVDCLDYENEFYPWRQFSDGVYWAAQPTRRTLGSFLRTGYLLWHAVAYNKPWTWRGYMWGIRNRDSPACRAARTALDVNDWSMWGGSRYFAHMNWSRKGTGF